MKYISMSTTTAPPPEVAPRDAKADRNALPAQPTHDRGEAAQWARRIPVILVLAAALIYCATAFRIASTKEPFIDEGWFASPAYNLAFHGFMGMSVIEPTGTWFNAELKGIREYTYLIMPLHPVVLAAWFRVFGFGLLQTRLLSAFWGAIALAAWFFIVERLTRNAAAGGLAALLLALDFTFLWSAADGRMDMMCVALGSAALAVYLKLREKNFDRALLAANCLAAASIFTHPNGVVWIAMLGALVLLYDWHRLRPRHLVVAAPYLVLLAGWGLYISRRPDYFLSQFIANLHPPVGQGARGSGLLHPLWALRQEWYRYQAEFGDAFWAAPVPAYAICIPFVLWTICAAAAIQWIRARDKALGTILLLFLLCLGFMTFADNLKTESYLGMIMPLYAAVVATWFFASGIPRRLAWLRYGLLAALMLFQIAVLGQKLQPNPLRDEFEPTVAFVKSLGNVPVTADSVFGFGLGYDHLNDDARLGMRSGRQPQVVIMDRWYWIDWQYVFPFSDPPAAAYVRNLLATAYHPIFGRGRYVVFQRNAASPSPTQPPSPAAASGR